MRCGVCKGMFVRKLGYPYHHQQVLSEQHCARLCYQNLLALIARFRYRVTFHGQQQLPRAIHASDTICPELLSCTSTAVGAHLQSSTPPGPAPLFALQPEATPRASKHSQDLQGR